MTSLNNPSGPIGDPLLLRVSEAARLMSISRSLAYELIARGEMPSVVRIGLSVRVSLDAVRAWIKEQTE